MRRAVEDVPQGERRGRGGQRHSLGAAEARAQRGGVRGGTSAPRQRHPECDQGQHGKPDPQVHPVRAHQQRRAQANPAQRPSSPPRAVQRPEAGERQRQRRGIRLRGGEEIHAVPIRGEGEVRCGGPDPGEGGAAAEQPAGPEDERGEPGEEAEPALDEEVGERGPHRDRQQRQQHPEAVLLPVERRPVLEADEHRHQGVRVLRAVEGAEVNPQRRGGAGGERDGGLAPPGAPVHHRFTRRRSPALSSAWATLSSASTCAGLAAVKRSRVAMMIAPFFPTETTRAGGESGGTGPRALGMYMSHPM